MGFTLTETDSGTKRETREALEKTSKELGKEFQEAIKEYWEAVYAATQRLCWELVYSGPESPHYKRTGTLYNTIRLVWELEPTGTAYEVVATSQGAEITALIIVGGQLINPTTGRICDYAQAVHDGTIYMQERPFLTMAIAECEPLLQEIMQKHLDEAFTGFTR